MKQVEYKRAELSFYKKLVKEDLKRRFYCIVKHKHELNPQDCKNIQGKYRCLNCSLLVHYNLKICTRCKTVLI